MNEVPEPFRPNGTWYAIRTDDQAAVLDAFDLTDPVRVTMRMGLAAWRSNGDGGTGWDAFDRHSQCGQMYVSPVLDGWILGFGELVDGRDLDRHDFMLNPRPGKDPSDFGWGNGPTEQERCAALSRRFGAVHWYAEIEDGGCGDRTGWCFAEGGEVVRDYYHDFYQGELAAGPPHPAEAGLRPLTQDIADWLWEHGLPPDLEEEMVGTVLDYETKEQYLAAWARFKEVTNLPESRTAATVAARASVGPLALGPHTRVEGTGVLALTLCGRRRGHRGALTI